MKHDIVSVILIALICTSACFAAITGPYPVGPGAAPLPSACAVVSRFDVIILPVPYMIVTVTQFVSPEALAAGVAVGQVNFDMDAADFKFYVLDPISAGTIKTYEAGVENWLIAKKLPGWSKL